jgi:hypothetical protein
VNHGHPTADEERMGRGVREKRGRVTTAERWKSILKPPMAEQQQGEILKGRGAQKSRESKRGLRTESNKNPESLASQRWRSDALTPMRRERDGWENRNE